MRYDDEDQEDFGQNDGDVSAPAFPGAATAFQPANPGQPWLRAGLPPWHLWGNTQQITTTVQSPVVPSTRTSTAGQLVKVAYKRPETWHWLFAAKLLSGPASDAGAQVAVYFDLSVGIGRAAIQMVYGNLFDPKNNGAFEAFFFRWGPAGAFPRGAQIFASQVQGPNRTLTTDAPFPNQDGFPVPGAFISGPTLIDQIVAQDIQLGCQVIALGGSADDPAIGQPVVVEVSAQFAPKTHVRSDWYQNAPDEVVFPGGEVGGS